MEPPLDPRAFVERILREHDAHRMTPDGARRWREDPDLAGLIALASMATRWDLGLSEFEAKLERLCRTPTGVARPAAARLLQLWRQERATHRQEPRLLHPPRPAPDPPVAPLHRSEPSASDGTERGSLTVLVVEDDAMILDLMREILRDQYHVLTAETGEQGLEVARREAPDAITLDLMLPDGHGARILAELKADPATAQIPVIVTSAYTGGLPVKHRSLAAKVLFKPFGPIELLDALNAVVRRA